MQPYRPVFIFGLSRLGSVPFLDSQSDIKQQSEYVAGHVRRPDSSWPRQHVNMGDFGSPDRMPIGQDFEFLTEIGSVQLLLDERGVNLHKESERIEKLLKLFLTSIRCDVRYYETARQSCSILGAKIAALLL